MHYRLDAGIPLSSPAQSTDPLESTYPNPTANDSTAMNDIIREILLATGLEQQGQAIDKGQSARMEDKKQEGYF